MTTPTIQDVQDALRWTDAVQRGEPHSFTEEQCHHLSTVRQWAGLPELPRPPLGPPPSWAPPVYYASGIPDGRRWWPISLRWRRGGCSTFFGKHGFEVDPRQRLVPPGVWPWQRMFATVLQIGALKIVFGARRGR
jgi:hypothetical protein